VIDLIGVFEVEGDFLSCSHVESCGLEPNVSGDNCNDIGSSAAWSCPPRRRRRCSLRRRRIRVHTSVRAADIRDHFGAAIIRCDQDESAAMWICQLWRLNRIEHLQAFAVENGDRAQIVADPQFLAVRRKDDVISRALSIRTRELLPNYGHRARINSRESSASLSLALAFVRDIGNLLVWGKADAIRPPARRRNTEDFPRIYVQFHELIRQAQADVARFPVLRYRRPDRAGAHREGRYLLHRLQADLGKPSVHLPAAGIASDARPNSHINEFAVRRGEPDVRIALEIARGNSAYYFVRRGIEQENRQGARK